MKLLLVLISMVLVVALGPAGCAPAAVQATPYEKLDGLVDALDFPFDVPRELPGGFYQGQMLALNDHTGSISFFMGDRELVFAVSSKADALKSYYGDLKFSKPFHTNDQEFEFYTASEDQEQMGAALWQKGNVSYALSGLTLYEAVGMIYSLGNAQDLGDGAALWLPQTDYASVDQLEAALGLSFPQPQIISDGYTLSRLYKAGPEIAAAEYTGEKGTLLYQATLSKKPLAAKYFAQEVVETESFFPKSANETEVKLICQQDPAFVQLTHWSYGDTLYSLRATHENTREQMLNLTREFCAWIEAAGQ